jgi:hypothetical protein
MLAVMDPKVTALERAFQLAKSGRVVGIPDIRAQLRREGYDEKAVDGGPSLSSQLRGLIKVARSGSTDAPRT